jgi:hypothetical protein
VFSGSFLFAVQLVHLFGSVRDDWMHQDLAGWLGANAIYQGVGPVLQQLVAAEDTEVYIVTTKQVCVCGGGVTASYRAVRHHCSCYHPLLPLALPSCCCGQAHYTAALLKDMAGVDLPMERIHSTTLSGEPKAMVLGRLAAAHPLAHQMVFVEDKMGTLLKVGGQDRVGWGCKGREGWDLDMAGLCCSSWIARREAAHTGGHRLCPERNGRLGSMTTLGAIAWL